MLMLSIFYLIDVEIHQSTYYCVNQSYQTTLHILALYWQLTLNVTVVIVKMLFDITFDTSKISINRNCSNHRPWNVLHS